MARICFVCNEIFPTRPGGAASLIYALAQALLAAGQEVVFLLDLTSQEFLQFDTVDRLTLPDPDRCRAYHVGALCAGMPHQERDFLSRYLWESYRYDFACRQVYAHEKPDIIEFVDFCGPAYYALCAKIAGIAYPDAHIVVRFHGLIQLIDLVSGARNLDFDRYTIYALERLSLSLAETVLISTPSILQQYSLLGDRPWFGNTVLSEPIVTIHPNREMEEPDADIALFYGRLFPQKGVDKFIDAAVVILTQDPDSALRFILAGTDSMEPPVIGLNSYQEYLRLRIPANFQDRFIFTGFLKRDQLEQLLPKVKFAVLPSVYETYCFAAHELRRAGIPLILSDIHVFKDHFQPEQDALFFNNSIRDLARQMQRLEEDTALRRKLSEPPTLAAKDHLGFYLHPPTSSWMTPVSPPTRIGLLVCIVLDQPGSDLIADTLQSLSSAKIENMRVVLLNKYHDKEQLSSPQAHLFGGRYTLCQPDSTPLSPLSVETTDTLLILRAGDILSAEFLHSGLQTLALQPRISYVSSWKWIVPQGKAWLNTLPLAAMPELAPFEAASAFNRCLMRTPPGILLLDLFDQKAGQLAEADYLWQIDRPDACGIQIPEPLIRQQAEAPVSPGAGALSYLVLKDNSSARQSRLATYLAMLAGAFPVPYLPIQGYIAHKNRIQAKASLASGRSIFSSESLRIQLVKYLSAGSAFSRRILSILRWVKSKLSTIL